jgi:oligosaccharide repeat unit polymerase
MLFPWIALFGLKFTHPELAAFPIYVTKEELTTVTLVYDAYYDFGIAGVILFVAAGTLLAAFFERMALRCISCGSNGALKFFFVMIYGQILIYMALAFFTTWLSNPTTWFLFGLTTLLSVVIWLLGGRKDRVE